MHKKRLVLLFDIEWFERVHLFKDVGMIPSYFSKLYHFDSSIVFYDHENNRSLKDDECGINLIRIKNNVISRVKWLKNFLSPMALYLMKNAKNIDVLMLFHLKNENYYYRYIYKLLNPSGKIFLKLDISLKTIELLELIHEESQKSLNIFLYKNGLIGYLKTIKRKFLYKRMKYELSKFDIISVETKNALERLQKIFGKKVSDNIILAPNGFPDNQENSRIVKGFFEKENIIMTVGRIGTVEKNNEMLLMAAEKLQLRDWKIFIIGPIEENFRSYLEDYYLRNPALKNQVIMAGNISEKRKLYAWYARSKVFCLTSRSEGFPLVFPEAIYFGNYVISTKIGAEEDITKDERLGKRINQEDIEALAITLQEIIDNKNDIGLKYDEIIEHSREYFVWDKIVEKLYTALYETTDNAKLKQE